MTNDTKQQIAQIKMYLRESMRHAISHDIPADSARARITRRYGEFPDAWFEGADDPETGRRTPLTSGSGSLPPDFGRYTPECRVVSLDACFSSFHRDSSIANAYIFSQDAPSPCWPTR